MNNISDLENELSKLNKDILESIDKTTIIIKLYRGNLNLPHEVLVEIKEKKTSLQ